MTDKFEKAQELVAQLQDLTDNIIVLASVNVKETDDKKTLKALMQLKGNAFEHATMLKHCLDINKELNAALKILDFIPNAYRTEEIKNEQTQN